eukprot:scaffold446117_cov63-Attheya_sp.AAC.1
MSRSSKENCGVAECVLVWVGTTWVPFHSLDSQAPGTLFLANHGDIVPPRSVVRRQNWDAIENKDSVGEISCLIDRAQPDKTNCLLPRKNDAVVDVSQRDRLEERNQVMVYPSFGKRRPLRIGPVHPHDVWVLVCPGTCRPCGFDHGSHFEWLVPWLPFVIWRVEPSSDDVRRTMMMMPPEYENFVSTIPSPHEDLFDHVGPKTKPNLY